MPRWCFRLVSARVITFPANSEFMGMTDYVLKSFYDLIVEGSETFSNSDSGGGSHHPSRECFMAGIYDVHDEGVHDGEATPTNG